MLWYNKCKTLLPMKLKKWKEPLIKEYKLIKPILLLCNFAKFLQKRPCFTIWFWKLPNYLTYLKTYLKSANINFFNVKSIIVCSLIKHYCKTYKTIQVNIYKKLGQL